MGGLAAEDQTFAFDADSAGDDADAQSFVLEDWPLLDVQFKLGNDIFQAGLRTLHRIEQHTVLGDDLGQ